MKNAFNYSLSNIPSSVFATIDGYISSIQQCEDRNSARITTSFYIPSLAEVLDFSNFTLSLRSRIARMGYEFIDITYRPELKTFSQEASSFRFQVQGTLHPIVKHFPTYYIPVSEVFRQNDALGRLFYENEKARISSQEEAESLIDSHRLHLPRGARILDDGRIKVPLDRQKEYNWSNRSIPSTKEKMLKLFRAILDGNIPRQELTERIICPTVVSNNRDGISLKPNEGKILSLHSDFWLGEGIYGVLDKIHSNRKTVHTQALLVDPGSGHPEIGSSISEQSGIKIEIYNQGQNTVYQKNMTISLYDERK